MKLTTIIIDDSNIQRLATANLVSKHHNLELIGAYQDPIAGLNAVNILAPDLLILDVEMPGLNGFEVLERLNCNCQVILYSTRQEFVLSAFQYQPVKAYLTKPLQISRFEQAVEKTVKNQSLRRGVQRNIETFVSMEPIARAS